MGSRRCLVGCDCRVCGWSIAESLVDEALLMKPFLILSHSSRDLIPWVESRTYRPGFNFWRLNNRNSSRIGPSKPARPVSEKGFPLRRMCLRVLKNKPTFSRKCGVHNGLTCHRQINCRLGATFKRSRFFSLRTYLAGVADREMCTPTSMRGHSVPRLKSWFSPWTRLTPLVTAICMLLLPLGQSC